VPGGRRGAVQFDDRNGRGRMGCSDHDGILRCQIAKFHNRNFTLLISQ
jgi:hypothetical protein